MLVKSLCTISAIPPLNETQSIENPENIVFRYEYTARVLHTVYHIALSHRHDTYRLQSGLLPLSRSDWTTGSAKKNNAGPDTDPSLHQKMYIANIMYPLYLTTIGSIENKKQTCNAGPYDIFYKTFWM